MAHVLTESFGRFRKLAGGTLALDTPAAVSASGIDTARMCVPCVVSTEALDRSKDRVSTPGILTDNHALNPVVLYEHGQHESKADPVALARDPDGAYTLQKLSERTVSVSWFTNKTQLSVQTFQLIDEGLLRGVSIGFKPVAADTNWDADFDERWDGRPGMLFKQIELVEYSHVCVPDNPEALVLVTEAYHRGQVGGEKMAEVIHKSLAAWATPASRSWSGGVTLEKPAKAGALVGMEELGTLAREAFQKAAEGMNETAGSDGGVLVQPEEAADPDRKSFDESKVSRAPDGKFADTDSPGEHHAGSKRQHETPTQAPSLDEARARVASLREAFDAHDEAEPPEYDAPDEPDEPELAEIPDAPEEPHASDYHGGTREPSPGDFADREEWQDAYDAWEASRDEFDAAHQEWEEEHAAWQAAAEKAEAANTQAQSAHHEALAKYRKDEAKARRAHQRAVARWDARREELADELDVAEEAFRAAGGDVQEFEKSFRPTPPLPPESAIRQSVPVNGKPDGERTMPDNTDSRETKRASRVRKESVEEMHDGQQVERADDEESPRATKRGRRAEKEFEDDITDTPKPDGQAAGKRGVTKNAGDDEAPDEEESGHAGDDSNLDAVPDEEIPEDDDAQPGEKALTMAYDRCCEAAEALDAVASKQENPQVAQLMEEVARGFEGLAKMTAEGFADQYPHKPPLDDAYAEGADGPGEAEPGDEEMPDEDKAEGFSDEGLGEDEDDGRGFRRKARARKSSPARARLQKRVAAWHKRQGRLKKRLNRSCKGIVGEAAEHLDDMGNDREVKRLHRTASKYHAGMLRKVLDMGDGKPAGDIEEEEMQAKQAQAVIKQLRQTVEDLRQQQARMAKRMQKAMPRF